MAFFYAQKDLTQIIEHPFGSEMPERKGISSCRQKDGTMPDTHDLRFVANQPNQQIGGKYHGRKKIHIF